MNPIYSVNFWDAQPSSGEDACNHGEDFTTLEAARERYETTDGKGCAWVELAVTMDPNNDYPRMIAERPNPNYTEQPDDERPIRECHHLDWYDATHGDGW
jgi:hypothetical protein